MVDAAGRSIDNCTVSVLGCSISIGAIAAAVSAIAAAVSLYYASRAYAIRYKQVSQEKQFRVAEAKHRYYKQMVAEPVRRDLDSFRDRAGRLLKEKRKSIKALHDDNARSDEVHQKLQETSTQFQDIQIEMMQSIVRSAEAWDKPQLRDDLRTVSEDIQDKVINEIGLLANRDENPDFQSIIDKSIARIDQLVRTNDPMIDAVDGE